ncbi:hypothetical protein QBC44DRAFT_312219 [Cladorrhinum sp. PSN332]|nr:hypothetical protein QBC44DRAFT_312219 [Cladorrhinum sp. PSN332]
MASTTARERRWWTKNEDKILQNGGQLQINEHGSIKNWNDLAALLPGRTNKDCRKRWYKVRLDIRKGAWLPEEDQKLRDAVDQLGVRWSVVAEMVQTRNADQCAKRWRHVLGPHIKHGPWSPDEDRVLLEAITRYGHNWKDIGLNELPDRSPHDIRNRSVALDRRTRRSDSETSRKSPQPPSPGSSEVTSEDQCGDSGDDFSSESYAVSSSFDTGNQPNPGAFLSTPFDAPGAPALQNAYNPGMDFVMSGIRDTDYSYNFGHVGQSSETVTDPSTDKMEPEMLLQPGQPPHFTRSQEDPAPVRDIWFSNTVPNCWQITNTTLSAQLAASLAAAGLINYSEADFMPNAVGQYPFHIDLPSEPAGSRLGSIEDTATTQPYNSETQPPLSAASAAAAAAKGHVTIVMGQGDLDLAQDVMGSLKQLGVDITMHLVRNGNNGGEQ